MWEKWPDGYTQFRRRWSAQNSSCPATTPPDAAGQLIGEYRDNASTATSQLFEYHPRFPGQYFDKETNLHYNHFRYYEPETGRYISPDPIGLAGGINTYLYAEANSLMYMDLFGLFSVADLPSIPQLVVDFSAGFGDALLLGTGGYLRNLTGVDGGVDSCSDAYDYGAIAALAASGGRMAYAGLAKAGSVFASSGVQASTFRAGLKTFFRGGIGRNWRSPNLAGKTDTQLRVSAGKTNFGANIYGVGVGVAGGIGAAQCGCQK